MDDVLIASRSPRLTRTMHSPQPSFQTAIAPNAPWEKDFAIGLVGTSVVADERLGVLRLYYALRNKTRGCGHGDQPTVADCNTEPGVTPQPNYEDSAGPILTALAESRDAGRTWSKPLLGKYAIGGSRANNVLGLMFGEGGDTHNTTQIDTVFLDPHAAPGSTRRYRGVSGAAPSYSADGLNWTLARSQWAAPCDSLFEGEWGTCGFDTKPQVLWDPPCAEGNGCWSFYTRFKNCVPPRPNTTQTLRMVRRARSFTLDPEAATAKVLWVNETVVMRADELDNATHSIWDAGAPPMDFYGAVPWYDAETGTYWMAAVRFWHWGPGQAHYPGGSRSAPGSYDMALASSRDGAHFEYAGGRRSWVTAGREGGVGSRRMWLAGPPVRVGDEDVYFVTRTNTAEGPSVSIDALSTSQGRGWESEVAVGRLRAQGLVSLDAPYVAQSEAAVLVTVPLVFTGSRLYLNLDSSGPGSLVVEARLASQSQASAPALTSVPLSANGVELLVLWGGDASSAGNASAIESLRGEAVVLTLRMQACSLYALRFKK